MSTPIVEARGLTKSFGKVQALAGLDLVAESGQVVAVLGPNGAGKTTFVRVGRHATSGPTGATLRVAGIDATTDLTRSAGSSASPASTPPSSPP